MTKPGAKRPKKTGVHRKPSPRPVSPHFSFDALFLPAATPEHRFHPERKWRFDFAWAPQRIALEIEGGTWQYGRHNRATGFLRDMEKYREAALLGWMVLRVTPEELKDGTAASLVDRAFGARQLEVKHP